MTNFVDRLHRRLRVRQAAAGVRVVNRKSSEFVFEPLEPRLLLSADPVLGLASAAEPVVIATTEPAVLSAGLLSDANTESLALQQEPARTASAAAAETQVRHEIVFVDSRVEGREQLLQDFLSQSNDERRFEVRVIDGEHDGIEQISQVLAGYSGLDAVHFISHGSDGAVLLGATWLDQNSLREMADSVARWSASLSADADLLFYGCNLAVSPQGIRFLDDLSLLTGADVAASVDLTGASERGGDWDLEYFSGPIETSIALSASAQSQWYSLLETPVGTEFRVNSTTANDQQTSPGSTGAIAMTTNGNFVVTWASELQDGSGWGIYAQRYNSSGTPLGGEFRVNNTATGDQVFANVAADGSGNFVITWSSDQNGDYDIYARRYNVNGTPLGSEFRVNTFTTNNQQNSSIAMANTGSFVVVWESQNQDGNSWGVFAQRYNAAGVAQGSEFQVNTFTTNVQQDPRVAMDSAGNFVITWSSNNQDGNSWGVYAQRYNASGVAQGGEFLVNTTTGGQQRDPAVAMSSTGAFVIAWRSNTDASTWGIYAQRYDDSGVAQGGEFQVNNTSTDDQIDPSVAMDTTGNFVITWSSKQSGTDFDVYGRQYASSGMPQGGEFQVNTTAVSDQQYASVAAGGGKFAVVWSSLNQDGNGYGVYGQLYDWGAAPNNSAPALNVSASPVFDAQVEDDGAPLGAVGTLVSSLVDFPGGGGLDNVTDPDPGALLGIAVTAADNSNGSWFYSIDGGTVWNALGNVSISNARLLASDARLYFQPNANYNGTLTSAITFRAWDQTSGSNGGLADTSVSGGPTAFSAATDSASLTVTAVNDAPQASNLSAAEIYAQNQPLNLTNIVITDVDSPNVTATLTLSDVNAGSLNTGTSGAVTSTYDAGTGLWSASGAIADVNALLAGLTFTPALNYNANFTISTSVDDGVAAPITGVKNMTFTAVNDAPQASNLSAGETYTEDTPLDLTDIVVSDVDSANVTVTLTLSDINAGSLNTGTSGAVTSTYDAGTEVWTASGAITDVNTLLAGLTFTPALNYNANFTISTSVDDGVAAPVTGMKNMTGVPVNDAPQATNLSAAETYTEDTPLDLTDIIISDVDGTDVTVTLTLSDINAGSLNTGTSGAVTSTYNEATGVWTASGAIADVNTLLAGLSFTPALNYNANFTISTSVDDGVAAPVTGMKNMTGVPVNDAPQATNLNAAETYTLNTPLNLADIVVSDVDSPNVIVRLTLSNPSAGRLSIGTSGAVTSTYNAGTGIWTASGAVADVNVLLANLTYTPSFLFIGSFTIATSVDDGVAAALTGVKNMSVSLVNLPPSATNLNASETYTEDTPLDLTNIVISDLDSPNVTARLTLSDPAAGSLNTGTSCAVTSTYNEATGVWSASGAIADVNALLAGLTFTPALNYDANFTIATRVDDGVAAPVTGVKTMTAVPVNDAPTASNLSAAETYTENQPLNLADIVISDVDSASVTAQLTLSDPLAGSLNTATSGAVTSTYNAGSGVWIANGAIADVNALLAGLTFTPALNYNSTFTIATSVDDGIAPPITGSKFMNSIAVNDAPMATNLGAGETYTEDTPLDLTDIVITDVDSANVTATLTLSDINAGSLNTGTSGAVTSTYNAGTGVWSASGAIADVNALLAGLTFTPALNYNANFTIATSVDDGVAAPITGVKTMTGVPVNDAPQATNLSAAETYTEDTPLDLADIVVSDVDSTNVTATLTLSDINAGSLNTGTSGAVTSTYNAGTGVWSASGAIADVNALLAGLTFTPALNYNSDFTISTSFDDGVAAPVTGVKTMTGVPVNDAPVLGNNALTISEGGTVVLSNGELSATDVDNAHSGLIFTVSGVTGGRFELLASPGVTITNFNQAQVMSGAVRFVHDGSAVAPSYDVTVSDGSLSYGPAVAMIKFVNLNDTPEPFPPPVAPPPEPSPVPGAIVENITPPPAESPSSIGSAADGATGDNDNRPLSLLGPDDFTAELAVSNNSMDSQAVDYTSRPSSVRTADKAPIDIREGMSTLSDASLITQESTLDEPRAGALTSGNLSSVVDLPSFVRELDKLRDEVNTETQLQKIVVGSTLTAVSGFSIGYVLWLVRGEILITSLLASLPAWRLIDPLPVLSFLAKRSDDDEEDDSVEAAVKKGIAAGSAQPAPMRQSGTRSIKWRMVMQPAEAIPENNL